MTTKNTLSKRSFLALGAAALLGGAMLTTSLPAHAHKGKSQFAVLGTGKVVVAPDLAFLTSGVISEGKTAESALNENTEKMTAVFKALEDAGISRKNISTSNFSVRPRYVQPKATKKEPAKPAYIASYTVSNTVNVKVDEMEKLGGVLREMVKFGANNLGAIRFGVSNREELLDEARKKAVADAQRKADLYMTATGARLGKIITIAERSNGRPRPIARSRILALQSAPSAPVPVSAGEADISVSVSITWEINQE